MKELRIPCTVRPADETVFEWYEPNESVAAAGGILDVQICRPDGGTVKSLDNVMTYEQARELFNWLGVQLHKYPGS